MTGGDDKRGDVPCVNCFAAKLQLPSLVPRSPLSSKPNLTAVPSQWQKPNPSRDIPPFRTATKLAFFIPSFANSRHPTTRITHQNTRTCMQGRRNASPPHTQHAHAHAHTIHMHTHTRARTCTHACNTHTHTHPPHPPAPPLAMNSPPACRSISSTSPGSVADRSLRRL